MTGYGKKTIQLSTKKITLELKSLNSKNLDLNVRIPGYYKEKELEVRKTISTHLKRGKIDFSIYVEMTADESLTSINSALVKDYMQQLRNIVQSGNTNDVELLQMAVRMPDALRTEREELDEEEWKIISEGINEVISKLIEYRTEEGKAMEADFKNRVSTIKSLLEKVISLDEERLQGIRTRLENTVEEIRAKNQLDRNRFEQEVLFYLEKLDINEEKVRLRSHLEYFEKTLDTPESNGKKLGFITQEMGREINTTGAKANFAPMQKVVIQMKNELEQIKEQVLNVL
ncbi:MAG: YicC family protein [Flavobacteriaceae bacterium]|nr:YicC family protein [Flavobacteriaceae bacterium]